MKASQCYFFHTYIQSAIKSLNECTNNMLRATYQKDEKFPKEMLVSLTENAIGDIRNSQQCLIEDVEPLSEVEIEFSMNFRTMLRKYFDSPVSTLLYRSLDKNVRNDIWIKFIRMIVEENKQGKMKSIKLYSRVLHSKAMREFSEQLPAEQYDLYLLLQAFEDEGSALVEQII